MRTLPDFAAKRSLRSSSAFFGLLLVSGIALGAAAQAAEPIGKSEKIENRVTGLVDNKSRVLVVPDAVHREEVIRTEAKAQAHLKLNDESDLRLGPDASLKLDATVFSGKAGAAMELARGTMRFVSGNGPKGSYLIKTPVATVGLRGTTVEVTIRNNRTYVSLHDGAAEICTRSGRCMALTNACTFLSVDNRGVTTPQPLNRRTPTFSSQCTGDFCVQDRCSQQLSNANPTPPAATPRAPRPPKANPPRQNPPKKRPPRASRLADDEYDVDEPVPLGPRAAPPPIFVPIPGFSIGPVIGPGRVPGMPRSPQAPVRIPGKRGLF